MTKTLYDPAVERRGIEQGIGQGIRQVAINLLSILDDEAIVKHTGLTLEVVQKLRKEKNKSQS
ncbi:MAG: hypothetical protein ACRDDX_04850 [Cellulosilyticaceae bacterium]